jgi:hypothetical protein
MSWLGSWGKPNPESYGGVEFWHTPDRCGWLTKQGAFFLALGSLPCLHCRTRFMTSAGCNAPVVTGEYIKTWRKR